MPDTSKEFTFAERAILRNQRLIMLALMNMASRLTVGGGQHQDALRERVEDMDKNWEFIAALSQRLVPYEPEG